MTSDGEPSGALVAAAGGVRRRTTMAAVDASLTAQAFSFFFEWRVLKILPVRQLPPLPPQRHSARLTSCSEAELPSLRLCSFPEGILLL